MLTNISISNIAVIKSCSFELSEGFNCLTGETGAGKSLIIDSINAILGERVSRDIIRAGEKKAVVQAQFWVNIDDIPEEFHYLLPEQDLIIMREMHADGRNVCRINGQLVTLAQLRELGRLLVNIHGQHDSQALLRPEAHIEYVQVLAGREHEQALLAYTEIYSKKNKLEREIKQMKNSAQQRAQRLDMLTYQVDELENCDLVEGEEEELEAQRKILANAEKLYEACQTVHGALYDSDGSAYELLSEASGELSVVADIDDTFTDDAEQLQDILYRVEDISSNVASYLAGISFSSDELDDINLRLDTISNLKRKYVKTVPELLEFLAEAKAEIEMLGNHDDILQAKESELAELCGELAVAAQKLTEVRRNFAHQLTAQVKEELRELDMNNVTFEVAMEPIPYTQNGAEKLEFLISTSPLEGLKPLAKIASGGEMSRICLALKSVLSRADKVNTLIFDEIDTGVSGRAAQRIARKLKRVAQDRQVICITHLAQIAASADAHYLIEKSIDEHDASTTVNRLDDETRTRELARIISGDNITQATLDAAKDMISD